MGLSAKSLAGPGYIILNVMRGLNIIGLLAVVIASFVMLVKTFVVSKFFFFDGASHLITGCVGLFLITSEVSLFRGYFARNWPLLSPSHGFVGLGFAMLVLGVNTLGNLNKAATSQQSLGMPLWRCVISAGILITILGFFNILASFIFRDHEKGVTARQVRAKGAVAITEKGSESGTTYNPSTPTRSPRPFNASRPGLPSYHTSPGASPTSAYTAYAEKEQRDTRPAMNISAPLNINPQFAHLFRPDNAHHPSVRVVHQ